MNRNEAAALEHHSLRESFLVMSNIVNRKVSKAGRKIVSAAIVRLAYFLAISSNANGRKLTIRMVRWNDMVRASCSSP